MYKADPETGVLTAGGTDGVAVSNVYDPSHVEWNPVRIEMEVRPDLPAESGATPLALRCNDGFCTKEYLDRQALVEIRNLSRVNEWRLALTEEGLADAEWGEPLTVQTAIDDTNTLIYAEVRATDPEGTVEDYSVMLRVTAMVEWAAWEEYDGLKFYELMPEILQEPGEVGGEAERSDFALGRRTVHFDENEIDMCFAYIEDGEAHVMYHEGADLVPLKDKIQQFEWEYLGSLGSAVDVAVEWDGYWDKPRGPQGIWSDRASDGTRWVKISTGEPWLFWVTPAGELLAKQGFMGTTVTLASGGVTRVSAVRAWKNNRFPDRDLGVVAAYLRDGDVFYRNLAEQSSGSVLWEVERPDYGALPNPDPPLFDVVDDIDHLQVFKTNDYRAGFLASTVSGNSHWAISPRNWAGMAIDDYHIEAEITNLVISFHTIVEHDVYHNETLKPSVQNLIVQDLWAGPIPMVDAENYDIDVQGVVDWGFRILLTFSHSLRDRDRNPGAFTVEDDMGNFYTVAETAAGPLDSQVVLETADFNAAVGDLTVTHDDSGALAGGAGTIGQSLGASVITFTPTGLTGVAADPPSLEVLWNE